MQGSLGEMRDMLVMEQNDLAALKRLKYGVTNASDYNVMADTTATR